MNGMDRWGRGFFSVDLLAWTSWPNYVLTLHAIPLVKNLVAFSTINKAESSHSPNRINTMKT